MKIQVLGPALVGAAISLTGVSFADEGTTEVQASAADYDSGPNLVIGFDVGAIVNGEADAGPFTLDIDDGSYLEGRLGLQVTDRIELGGFVSREATEINVGPFQADADLWTLGLYGQADVYKGDGKGFFVHGLLGLSKGEVGMAIANVDLDDGTTYGGGVGYDFEVGGLDAHVKYGFLKTDGLDVGGFAETEFTRHVVSFGFDLG